MIVPLFLFLPFLSLFETRCDDGVDCRLGKRRLKELEEESKKSDGPTIPDLQPQMLPPLVPTTLIPPQPEPATVVNSPQPAATPRPTVATVAAQPEPATVVAPPATLTAQTTPSSMNSTEKAAIPVPKENHKASYLLDYITVTLAEAPTSYWILWIGIGAVTVIVIAGIYIGCRRMKRIPPPPSMEPPDAPWGSDYNGGYDRIGY